MNVSINTYDICFREYKRFSVVYSLRNKMIFTVEGVASDIFSFIAAAIESNDNEIAKYIIGEYEIDAKTAHKDVVDYLIELYKAGLILIDGEYSPDSQSIAVESNSTGDFEGQVINACEEINQLYSATIEMTYRCNEHCVHCYANSPYTDHEPQNLSFADHASLLLQLKEIGCLHLAFTGGDPFVNNIFIDVFKYARDLGFVCDIYTNGVFLANHHDVLEEMLGLMPRGFYISLYGSTPNIHDRITGVSGSYDKTIEVIKLLRESHATVVVNVMVLSLNSGDIGNILNLLDDLDVHYRVNMSIINANNGDTTPMNYFESRPEIIKSVVRRAGSNMMSIDATKPSETILDSDYICGAAVTSISISPDGTVYPCVSLKNKLGSICEQPLLEIWNSNKRRSILQSLKWQNTIECNQCPTRMYCLHCPGVSQAETGNELACNACDRLLSTCMYEISHENEG